MEYEENVGGYAKHIRYVDPNSVEVEVDDIHYIRKRVAGFDGSEYVRINNKAYYV